MTRYPLIDVCSPSSPCEDNISLLMGAYYPSLHRMATSRLRYSSTAVMDADDAVSSAFTCFWQGATDGRFDVTSDKDVYWILNMLVSRRCNDQINYARSLRRSSTITEAMDEATMDGIMGSDPDPVDTMCALDMISVIMTRLDGRDREIMSYRLDGWTADETAEQIGVDVRTVSRRMLALRDLYATIRQ